MPLCPMLLLLFLLLIINYYYYYHYYYYFIVIIIIVIIAPAHKEIYTKWRQSSRLIVSLTACLTVLILQQ